MKKEEIIRVYGEEAYERHRDRARITKRKWDAEHRDENLRKRKEWDEEHPERYEAKKRELGRKGGKYYEHHLKYDAEGLPHERKLIRMKHRNKWRPYKRIIAPGSQLHHQWLPGIADYTGLALVEADQHMHGFIDVIRILEGEITLLTEKEITEDLGPD